MQTIMASPLDVDRQDFRRRIHPRQYSPTQLGVQDNHKLRRRRHHIRRLTLEVDTLPRRETGVLLML